MHDKTCPRCGAATSDGVLVILPSGGRRDGLKREQGCTACALQFRSYTGELRPWMVEDRPATPDEVTKSTACEGCSRFMLIGSDRVRRWNTPLADRFCPDCLAKREQEATRTRVNLSRQTRKEASGTPTWTCSECDAEITGRVFRYWWREARLCEACETTRQVEQNRKAWEQSVENGTPGKWAGIIANYEIPNPDDFSPKLETQTCEICAREVGFARTMHVRRDVVWCGHDACYAGAVKLAKRVPPVEARPCEQCGEMHTKKRRARFCSDVCRALAFRKRTDSG